MGVSQDLHAELVLLRGRVDLRRQSLDTGEKWYVVAQELLHDLTETEYWVARMLESRP